MNNFAKTELYTKIKPAFYMLLDPIYFDNAATFDDGFELKERSIIDLIIQKTNWPLKVLTSCAAGDFFRDKFKANVNITVYDFNTYSLETNTKLDYLFYSNLYFAHYVSHHVTFLICFHLNYI